MSRRLFVVQQVGFCPVAAAAQASVHGSVLTASDVAKLVRVLLLSTSFLS